MLGGTEGSFCPDVRCGEHVEGMVPMHGQHFLLHPEVPGPAKFTGCPCHRGAEAGAAHELLPALQVLHHELLLELTLLLAFFQASKLQCRWIMTAGELCCICKSPSYIKGTSEQVSAVHMKGLLSLHGGSWWGAIVARGCHVHGFCLPCQASLIRRKQLQALLHVCRARKCPVLRVKGAGGGRETSGYLVICSVLESKA